MTVNLPRTLNLSTNPAGWLAATGAVYAAAVMIYNATHHHGVIDTNVIIAAVGAVGALLTRQVVTPVADPKNGAGVPLAPVPVPVTPPAPGGTQPVPVVPVVSPPAPGGTQPVPVVPVVSPPAP